MSNINYTAIRRIKQDEFKTFADFVYDGMNNKPIYAPFQTAVTDMQTKAVAFQEALVASKSRAIPAVEAKKAAQEQLYLALLRIAKLMDAEWQTAEQDHLKTNAGFTLNKSTERKEVSYVLPPTNLNAYNDPRRGIIIVSFSKAAHAVTTAFEIKQDEGDWQNGVYCENSKMELSFPFGVKLMIRAKTVGPKSLTSEFTSPVEVMVS